MLKPVEKGLLRAEGFTMRFGKSISYAESSVLDAHGELIAHGTSTLMTLAGQGIERERQKKTELYDHSLLHEMWICRQDPDTFE